MSNQGTGYGNYENESTWDPASMRALQAERDAALVLLLDMLGHVVNSGAALPPVLAHIVTDSGFFAMMVNDTLRNESMADVLRRFELYTRVFDLVGGFAVVFPLHPILTHSVDGSATVAVLVARMAESAATYRALTVKDAADGERGSLENDLLDKIARVAKAVKRTAHRQTNAMLTTSLVAIPDDAVSTAGYELAMGPLQFGEFLIKRDESSEATIAGDHLCQSEFYWAKHCVEAGQCNPTRTLRLASEYTTLSLALPLSRGSSCFARVDSDRMECMQFAITGPEDTPYAHGRVCVCVCVCVCVIVVGCLV